MLDREAEVALVCSEISFVDFWVSGVREFAPHSVVSLLATQSDLLTPFRKSIQTWL
jgi:hypothetical protein